LSGRQSDEASTSQDHRGRQPARVKRSRQSGESSEPEHRGRQPARVKRSRQSGECSELQVTSSDCRSGTLVLSDYCIIQESTYHGWLVSQ